MTDPILNPTVFIGSFEWREPVTTLTDFMVAGAAWLGYKFHTSRSSLATASFIHYRNYFLLFALSMCCAAWIGHGLQAYVGPRWKVLGWLFSAAAIFSLGLASLAEVKAKLNRTAQVTIKTLLVLNFIVFSMLYLVPQTSSFEVSQLGTAVGLCCFVLPLQAYNFWLTQNRGSLLILLLLAYGLVPSYVYNNQISLNRWMNYHDISHLLVFVFVMAMIVATSYLSLTSPFQLKQLFQRR